jgi:hypothetical protein
MRVEVNKNEKEASRAKEAVSHDSDRKNRDSKRLRRENKKRNPSRDDGRWSHQRERGGRNKSSVLEPKQLNPVQDAGFFRACLIKGLSTRSISFEAAEQRAERSDNCLFYFFINQLDKL